MTQVLLDPVAATPRLVEPDPSGPRRRRRRAAGAYGERPGALVYGCLAAVLLGSVFPLWWSFVIGSLDKTAVNAPTPPMLPGGNFLRNAATVVDTIPFWRAFANSLIVSTAVAASVVLFSTLAGYAFAKLRFRGKNGLLVFVVSTLR